MVHQHVVEDAGLIDAVHAIAGEGFIEFCRRDELVPAMRALRQPAENVFGADDCQRESLWRAVDGGDEHQPAGLHHRAAGFHEEVHVCDVLNDFKVEHDVELLASLGKGFGGGLAVVHGHAGFFCVDLGNLDICARGVGGDNLGSQSCHRFGYQSAAAAYVEDAQAFKRFARLRAVAEMAADMIADIGKADRVELV